MALPLQAEVRAAFLRFRDQHDHEALATVFDRTAQGLLLVANHLAAPGVDAEDLVQTTFVQAIRNAHAFDASRPLEPWLLGILTNEAHNARRRAMRRVDPERVRVEASDDPAARAEAREEVARMQSSIEAMPEPTRSVLVLYLVHGMTPTEIAHALGHPVGSVKSWVHRGLERLRDRLPVGLAVAIAFGSATASFAQLRTAVLAEGRAAIDGLAQSIRADAAGQIGKHGAIWLRLACLLACVGIPVWWWAAGAGDAATVDSTARAFAPDVGVDGEPLSSVGRGGNPHEAPSRVASADGTVAELHLSVRWADGTPAAIGFGVSPTYICDARLGRRDASTDASGRAQMGGLAPGSVTLTLDRGVERCVLLHPGANKVDVELPVGVAVRGRVVDERGEPVAGATVWLSHQPRRDDGWSVAQSATDGSFTVRDVPVGCAMAAFADGFVPTRALTCSDPADATTETVLAFERRAAAVSIEVVGENGAPVADALVQVGASEILPADGRVATDDCRSPPPWLGRTDAEGRVVCKQAADSGSVAVFARAHGARGASQSWRAKEPTGLRLVLPPSRTFRGVVKSADATTVVRVRGAVPERGADAAPHWFQPSARVAPDGTFTMLGVTCEALVAESRGEAGLALVERAAGVGEVAAWTAVLAPGMKVTGRVRAASGEPLVGLRVAICAAGCRHETILAADGTFACDGLGDLDYELVVHEPGGGPGFLVRRVGVRGGDVLDVEVPVGDLPRSAVRGRLVRANGEPMAAAMVFSYPRAFPSRSVRCDVDGRFAVTELPAGRFLLLDGGYPYELVRPFELQSGDAVDLGTIVAEAGARCRVQIDAQMPRAGLEVTLCTPGTPSTMVAVARWLGPSPVVTLPAPPGEYLLELVANGTSVHQQIVTLPAAGEVAVDVPVPVGLRCVFEARLPGGDRCTWMRWLVQGDGARREMMSGPRGPGERRIWRVAAQLPPGRYRVQAIADCGERGDGEFEVAAGSTGPFVLTLR